MQKFPYGGGPQKRRPVSAVVGFRPQSGKPKIDAKFIADRTLWDPATPRGESRRMRPASAPVRKYRFAFLQLIKYVCVCF